MQIDTIVMTANGIVIYYKNDKEEVKRLEFMDEDIVNAGDVMAEPNPVHSTEIGLPAPAPVFSKTVRTKRENNSKLIRAVLKGLKAGDLSDANRFVEKFKSCLLKAVVACDGKDVDSVEEGDL